MFYFALHDLITCLDASFH